MTRDGRRPSREEAISEAAAIFLEACIRIETETAIAASAEASPERAA